MSSLRKGGTFSWTSSVYNNSVYVINDIFSPPKLPKNAKEEWEHIMIEFKNARTWNRATTQLTEYIISHQNPARAQIFRSSSHRTMDLLQSMVL